MESTYTVKVNGKVIVSGLTSYEVARMDYQAQFRLNLKNHTGASIELIDSNDPENPIHAATAR